MSTFLIAAISYLLGSIPFGFLLVRIFRGQDVRHTGSGNIGATNVMRTSPALGVLTLLLDALKGSAAVLVALAWSRHEMMDWAYANVPWLPDHHSTALSPVVAVRASTAAVLAILGHMFPAWLKFRGGKGVATALGSFAILAPETILLTLGVFVAVVLLSRRVSLGSIIAVALFPVFAWLLRDYRGAPQVLALMAAASMLIIAKHHQNIRRLLAGTEPRFTPWVKKQA
jgi:acyl phosphate:glycerol-3-phosphate acyltransferase